jgi:hypothetical protein
MTYRGMTLRCSSCDQELGAATAFDKPVAGEAG